MLTETERNIEIQSAGDINYINGWKKTITPKMVLGCFVIIAIVQGDNSDNVRMKGIKNENTIYTGTMEGWNT